MSYILLNFIVSCSYWSTVRSLDMQWEGQPANYT